jgi:hypothetical protein
LDELVGVLAARARINYGGELEGRTEAWELIGRTLGQVEAIVQETNEYFRGTSGFEGWKIGDDEAASSVISLGG